ncbi:twin transmembrane helix small protein [Octadecabacter sp. 1_MG-2023]|uniref:twin transmembrane helix small protein n=1 Tax=unclassified Octadecabacter TaxID=196158 RepID=UPI001C089804|nr:MULTISPECIES: twin transmembrane helix small protein [unclassified Octadecabacter]MBU2992633.1 twin transmembrane helix small protein [Octadecabacter sp. B2R22]MDO6734610.1 twin transmembrane helix small protein [Octadecabacter sp. 1_MG-2023]
MVNDPFFYVIIAACLLVAVILAWGLSTFQAGGDGKRSNKIMQLRIAAQFVAVVLIVAFAYFKSKGS